MDGWMCEWSGGWVDVCRDWMDGWVNGHVGEVLGGRVDGWGVWTFLMKGGSMIIS